MTSLGHPLSVSSAEGIRAARGCCGSARYLVVCLGARGSDLSLTFGVAQELPLLFVPLSAATVGAHWALIRGREHYPSDVFARRRARDRGRARRLVPVADAS